MQYAMVPPLDPKRYYSPSGRYALFVDPGSPTGSGSAFYRLTLSGKTIWERTHPFTLREAGVTDTGIVGGYGYSQGLEGWGKNPRGQKGYGTLDRVILNPTGQVILYQKTTRQTSRIIHGHPDPQSSGIIVDGEGDRLIVRSASTYWEGEGERWEAYSLSTGKVLPVTNPARFHGANSPSQALIDARPVPGTPFTLLHWWYYDEKTLGARFSLVLPEGKPIWKQDLPDDYEIPGKEEVQDALRDEIRKSGAILETTRPGRFTLRFVKANQRVTFEVSKEGKVREVGRSPYEAPAELVFAAKKVVPVVRERINLKVPSKQNPSPIHSIQTISSAGNGQIAFLRKSNQPALVVVNAAGRVVKTISLTGVLNPPEFAKLLLRIGTERILIFIEKQIKTVTTTRVVEADITTGKLSPIPAFQAEWVETVAAFPDGSGFMIRQPLSGGISAWSRQGKKLWEGMKDGGGNEGSTSESVAVLKNGTIAVLAHNPSAVYLYDRRARFLKQILLEKAWRHEPRYPSVILPASDGGFVVHDFLGKPSIYWMNTRGVVQRRYTLCYSSGAPITHPELCISDSGQLWAADEHSILGIGPDGRANLRLGEPPRTDRLAQIGDIQVFPDGDILIEDARTDSVHLFAPNGQWKRVHAPAKVRESTPDLMLRPPVLECGPAGAFFYKGAWFDATGKRGKVPAGFQSLAQRRPAIKRHANGTWLESGFDVGEGTLAVTPEGNLAVLSRGQVSLYDPDNRPLRTLKPPVLGWDSAVAYDGKLVIVTGQGGIWCWGADGTPRWHADFPHPKGSDYQWRPFLTENSRTLLLFDGEAFTQLTLPAI